MNTRLLRLFAVVLSCLSVTACASFGAKNIDWMKAREEAIWQYRQSKGGTWKLALSDLKEVAKTPQGNGDWKTWYWLAKIANELNDIETAIPAARRALELAGSETIKREKSNALVRYLEYSFVPVTFYILGEEDQTLARIKLETVQSIINKHLRTVFQNLQERLREGVELPATFYLPRGQYRANGIEFKAKLGEPLEIQIPSLEER